MTISSSVRFAGLKDYIVPNEAGKQHVPYVKNVYSLKKDSIAAAEPCAQGVKIKLPDDTFAYVHPYKANVQHRLGAHKLAKQLQFDISPKVKAIAIPEELSQEKPRPTSPFGTIVDWIDGPTFKVFSGMASPKRKQFDLTNLIEMYLFCLISQDSDFHNRNIIVKIPPEKEKPVKLFAIDNEKTGADPVEFVAKLKKYPAELKRRVEGKTLPHETQVKLQQFLANRGTGEPKLQTYFPDARVENFYQVAQFVLELGKVPTQEQISTLMSTLQPIEDPVEGNVEKEKDTQTEPVQQLPIEQPQHTVQIDTVSGQQPTIAEFMEGMVRNMIQRLDFLK